MAVAGQLPATAAPVQGAGGINLFGNAVTLAGAATSTVLAAIYMTI